MAVTLGLDLGPNSIGWALVDDTDDRIVAAGVRAFQEGVDNYGGGKKEVSRNEQRRMARSARRTHRRRSLRKARLRQALTAAGLFPADPGEQAELYRLDPYALRAKARREALAPFEIGRALLHINQRRGFQSLRKHKKADKSESEMLSEIEGLAGELKRAKQTLGEYLHQKNQALQHACRRPDDGVRSRHTRRQMLADEFDAICDAQREFHPDLITETLCYGTMGREASHAKMVRPPVAKHDPSRNGRDDLTSFGLFGLIFFQRSVYWPRSVVGLCELEPKQKRCRLAHRKAQRFRMLQEINNLRYIDPDTRTECSLDADQRALLLSHLATRKEATFDSIRKKLTFEEGIRFNLERAKRTKLKGMTTDYLIARAFGKAWHKREEQEKDRIVSILLEADIDEDAAQDSLVEQFGFRLAEAGTLLSVDLPTGYGNLSLVAIRKLLPHLERGLRYMANDESDSALHAAGYMRRDQLRRRVFDRLPMPERLKDSKIGDIPNPVVKRALVELRKVVNAILREYGKPDAIHVEMARSVQMGRERRGEYIRAMRQREKDRDKAAEEIRKLGHRPTRDAITRYLLWDRQGGDCLYCGRKMSKTQLFGGEVDVDHILPRSRSLDDSQANKVACHRKCNAEKGQRTVHEWLAASDPDRFERVCQHAQKLLRGGALPYGTYLRILQKSVDLDGFISRQLVDTGYIAKATAEYLKCLFGSDSAVLGLKGQYTAKLRHQWGLGTILSEFPDSPAWAAKADLRPGEKNRADHRHHAIDAIVLALTNRSRLQELARHRRIGGPEGIDRSTGELFEAAPPWEGFRRSVVEAVRDIKVSHRVRRRVSGGLHEDKYYGPVYDNARERVEGQFVIRKKVVDLSPTEVAQIRDHGIRRLVEARLAKAGIEIGRGKKFGDEYKAAVADLAMPSGVPVKSVRVYRNDLTIQPLRSGDPGDVWVKPGSNHHLCIFEWDENGQSKREAAFVTRLEAAKRAKCGEAIIRRTPPENHKSIPADARFVMSLSAGEMVLAEHKGRDVLLRFKTAASTQGQIYFVEHLDARPSGSDGSFAKKASTLVGRKVTVDPLGRIRWAND